MLVSIFRLILAVLGGYAGYLVDARYAYHIAPISRPFADFINPLIFSTLGAAVGYVLGGVLGRRSIEFSTWVERSSSRISASGIFAGALGMTAGLVMGALIYVPMSGLKPFGPYAAIFVSIVAAYTGLLIGFRRSPEFAGLLGLSHVSDFAPGTEKLIDTSAIIDGRILEVARSLFLEGRLTVPIFVLDELQAVADSNDSHKRSRGRRGLEVLKGLQEESTVSVQVIDVDFPDLHEVDAKLVRLARQRGAAIMTNDYNLKGIAEIQDVPVLNVNELAHALRPSVLPGEEIAVSLLREGKDKGQAVGYLDDGTMVVVEESRGKIGEDVVIEVTSSLQTSSGRMVFGRPLRQKNGGHS